MRRCACGCGQATNLIGMTSTAKGRVKGEYAKFVAGHAHRLAQTAWSQDRRTGRWRVLGRHGKKYLWYRVVMENALGRPLLRSETVHHINGDCTDDRLENLELMTRSEHATLHMRAKGWGAVTVACFHCGRLTTKPTSQAHYARSFCGNGCYRAYMRVAGVPVNRVPAFLKEAA